MEYIITTANLKSFINDLIGEYTVYAPKKIGASTALYEAIASLDEYDSTVLITNTPAKGKIYPQCDKLLDFTRTDNSVELHPSPLKEKGTVIFGCRPCDTKGFSLLDKLFDWAEYRDDEYFARRNKTTIISVSCTTTPEPTCFCNSFENGGPASKSGSDLLLTPMGDRYFVEVVTEKWEKILQQNRYFEPATESDTASKQEAVQSISAKMTKQLNLDEIKKALDHAFESPYWDSVHLPCLKCNVCTFVCPTCYCFDISECSKGYTDGERNRTWDSCMSELFTRMAGGVNPRSDPKRRFRQRFMHKFRYHFDNFNEYLCTGCGRCIKYCPVGIDVRRVLEGVK